MAEYVDNASSFTPGTHIEPTYWQHDPRKSCRARHYRVDWPDLVEAFRRSYEIAQSSPEKYRSMSPAAIDAAARHNSLEILQERLKACLHDNFNLRSEVRSATNTGSR